MTALRGMYPLDAATPSLQREQPRIAGRGAPDGTLFVLGDEGGYAAVPGAANKLVLGRNSNEVHVTVGAGDGGVSRRHALLQSDPVDGWRLRNDGRLPIRIPDQPELLHAQELTVPSGYTPLYVTGTRRHVVEMLVSDPASDSVPAGPETGTRDLSLPLSDRERLVLVALFQNHLYRLPRAVALSWRETGRTLNEVPGQRGWTERKAESVVDAVRQRLSSCGHDGLRAESAPPEAIKQNLLRLLTSTATLIPPDLRLLEAGLLAPAGEQR